MNEGDYYYNWGVSFGHQENWDEAISSYSKAIEINPNDYEAYGNRGVVHWSNGELNLAINDFEKSLDIKPENNPIASFNLANYYYEQGISYIEQGKGTEAFQMFEKGRLLNPRWFGLESTKNKIAQLLQLILP